MRTELLEQQWRRKKGKVWKWLRHLHRFSYDVARKRQRKLCSLQWNNNEILKNWQTNHNKSARGHGRTTCNHHQELLLIIAWEGTQAPQSCAVMTNDHLRQAIDSTWIQTMLKLCYSTEKHAYSVGKLTLCASAASNQSLFCWNCTSQLTYL